MTKFIVHIGDGKCGSSSVQKGLYEIRDKLRDKGIIYETETPLHGHFGLVSLVGKENREAASVEATIQRAQKTIALIRANLRADSTVLLSAESFFNLSSANLINILKLISPDIDQLDLIAYVRAPHSMYLSLVQQIIKADSSFPMPDQYARPIDIILKRWNDCADVATLTVRNFDRNHLEDGDVVPDFTRVLRGLTGHEDIDLPALSVNTTLSSEQLVILQKYRAQFLKAHDGKLHKDSQNVIAYFEALNTAGFPGSKPVLTNSALASLRPANHKITEALKVQFPTLALNIPETPPPDTELVSWKPDGNIAQILARLDPDILALTRTLVSQFQRSVTLGEIENMVGEIRAVCDVHQLDATLILAETLGFWRKMGLKKRAEILKLMITPETSDISNAPESKPHPMILYGKGDWLFLKSDRYRVMEQIAGTYPLKTGFRKSWEDLFEARAEMARQIGYQYFYGIAPNKECVYSDQLPSGITVTPKRPVTQVLEAATGRVAHRYYLDALLAKRNTGEEVFVTGDTHWNHIGALVAFNEAMHAMGLPSMHEDEFIHEVRDIKADLSMKMGQTCPAAILAVRDPKFRLIEDNKVNNIGHRRIYENQDRTLPSCVYFRDSFTSHQLEMFASQFSRIVYLWQPNIDYEIVKNESPDFVISQQVERFLVECPNDVLGPPHAEYERRKTG